MALGGACEGWGGFQDREGTFFKSSYSSLVFFFLVFGLFFLEGVTLPVYAKLTNFENLTEQPLVFCQLGPRRSWRLVGRGVCARPPPRDCRSRRRPHPGTGG